MILSLKDTHLSMPAVPLRLCKGRFRYGLDSEPPPNGDAGRLIYWWINEETASLAAAYPSCLHIPFSGSRAEGANASAASDETRNPEHGIEPPPDPEGRIVSDRAQI